jgi:hypothetical protein
MKSKKEKTPSKTSPKGGRRGCLCDDGKYDPKCCDGTLQAQGVGSLVQSSDSITYNIVPRDIG